MKLPVCLSICLLFTLPSAGAETKCPDAELTLDHVIWAVPDLEKGIAFFSEQTGIQPVYGGEHSNGVTANFLVAVGACTYLEIVGPKPGGELSGLGAGAGRYSSKNMAGFALGLADANNAQALFQKAGIEAGALREGSRNKPDGSLVAWKSTSLPGEFGDHTFQFSIEWTAGVHPALTSPKGITLKRLILMGDRAYQYSELVEQFGLPITIMAEGSRNIRLELETPNGLLVLD